MKCERTFRSPFGKPPPRRVTVPSKTAARIREGNRHLLTEKKRP